MQQQKKFFTDIPDDRKIPALIGEEGWISYAELVRVADIVGERASARPRSTALLICKNDMDSVIAYVGFLRHGVVPILVSDSLPTELIATLMDAYRPDYLFASDENPLSKEGVGACVFSGHSLRELRDPDEARDYEVHPDLALLLTTSGSTGSPKLVRQSYENIASNTAAIVRFLGIVPSDRAITTLSMSYTYGLSIVSTHLAAGASLIMTDRTLMERPFWTLLKDNEATTFGGVPYTYEMLKRLRFAGMDLPSLRYVTQSGAKMPPELAAEFVDVCAAKGIKFIAMYGQTEATARMSYLPWAYAAAKAGSIGNAIPGGEFWLAGADGSRISETEATGELFYRGPNVTMGYAENRFDLARGDENGGVLATGDMARRDADGFYYIVGRKKRFLKIFGLRVNQDEVERMLRMAGFDCACGGVDDCLKIYLAAGEPEAVRRFMLEHTAVNPAGFVVQPIREIPRNSSGKVLYSELEDGEPGQGATE